MEKFLNNLKLALEKYGTLLVDRRLFVTLLLVFGTIFGVDAWVTDSEALATDVVEAIQLLVSASVALVSVISLVFSYTKRPASGLNYKTPNPEEAIERAVTNALKNITK